MRRTIFLALRLTLLPFLIRELVQRRRITIITYHDPTPEILAAHPTVLKRVYNIVSLATYAEAMRKAAISQLSPEADVRARGTSVENSQS